MENNDAFIEGEEAVYYDKILPARFHFQDSFNEINRYLDDTKALTERAEKAGLSDKQLYCIGLTMNYYKDLENKNYDNEFEQIDGRSHYSREDVVTLLKINAERSGLNDKQLDLLYEYRQGYEMYQNSSEKEEYEFYDYKDMPGYDIMQSSKDEFCLETFEEFGRAYGLTNYVEVADKILSEKPLIKDISDIINMRNANENAEENIEEIDDIEDYEAKHFAGLNDDVEQTEVDLEKDLDIENDINKSR